MPFLDTFIIEQDGPATFALKRDLHYEGKHETFLVPSGFVTDFATVPQVFTWLIPRYGVYTRAAMLHDYLCVEAHWTRFSRRDADGIFRRVLEEDGVSLPRRWLMWAAVRVGGGMSEATLGDWLRLVVIGLLAVPFLLIPTLIVSVWTLIFWLIEKMLPTRSHHA